MTVTSLEEIGKVAKEQEKNYEVHTKIIQMRS